jgi:iron complex outermembrane receptor protein
MQFSMSALVFAIASPAIAQPADAPETAPGEALGDIVVTAQRKSEDAQKAALAVTVATGDELIDKGVTNVQQLSDMTPALEISAATGTYTWFSVRGVSNTGANAFADPALAVNVDGVYLAAPAAIHGMMFDIERVEVLKGPQGTLYGRNATAGAINIISRRPTFDTNGSFTAELGNYDSIYAQAAVNIPLSDTFAVRAAGMSSNHDGWFSDGSGDDETNGGRLSLLFEPSPDLSLLVVGDFANQGGRGGGSTIYNLCGDEPCYPGGAWTGLADLPGEFAPYAPQTRNTYLDNQYRGLTGQLDFNAGFGTFTLLASRRWADVDYASTTVGFLIDEQQKSTQTSVEARLASEGSGPLNWVLGAYYLDTAMDARSRTENATARSFGDQLTSTGTTSWAGFGQATFALSERFRAVGGVRYTTEKKFSDTERYNISNLPGPDPIFPDIPPGSPIYNVDETATWSAFNWKAGIEYDIADRSLFYANVSTGFKAGGFFSGPPGADTYDPEHLTAYLIGFKNRLFDNRLQLNAELFYMDYRDQQISYTKQVGAASIFVTENAGKLVSKGFEIEADWLAARHTRIGAQVQYLDAVYKDLVYFTPFPPPASTACALTRGLPQGTQVDCSGLAAQQSPKWAISGNIEQGIEFADGTMLVGQVGAHYEGDRETHVNYLPDTVARANTRWDASLTYEVPDSALRVTAFVKNLTNVATPTYLRPSSTFNSNGAVIAVLKQPRTYGIRLSANF